LVQNLESRRLPIDKTVSHQKKGQRRWSTSRTDPSDASLPPGTNDTSVASRRRNHVISAVVLRDPGCDLRNLPVALKRSSENELSAASLAGHESKSQIGTTAGRHALSAKAREQPTHSEDHRSKTEDRSNDIGLRTRLGAGRDSKVLPLASRRRRTVVRRRQTTGLMTLTIQTVPSCRFFG
jgi:hypothetical protein